MSGLRLSKHGAFALVCFAVAGVGVVWHLFGEDAAGIAATLVTFAAIAWTAYETAALRAETVRQTEVEQRPLIVPANPTGGVLRVQDSSELHNIPMLVKLRVTQDEGHEPRNEVRGYAAVAGATITTPAVTKPAAKPTGRPAAAPWAKAKSGEAA